jgi:hypothetical protein
MGHDLYLILRNMLTYNRRLNSRFFNEDMNTTSMGADVARVKKHGKKLRVMLRQSDRKRGSKLGTMTTVKSFFRITDIDYIGDEAFSKLIGTWNLWPLKTRIKTFIFKFFNNSLGINTRLSHLHNRGLDFDRKCTLCTVKGVANPSEETFSHLFIDCPTAGVWRQGFIRDFLRQNVMTDIETKKLWCLGYLPEMGSWELIAFLCIIVFQFLVWEQKLNKRVPSYNSFLNLFKEELRCVLNSKRSWALDFDNLRIPLRRILPGRENDGGGGAGAGAAGAGIGGAGGAGRGRAGREQGQADRLWIGGNAGEVAEVRHGDNI